MLAQAHPLNRVPALWRGLVFALGTVALLATFSVLYGWISLGTEALLAPWPCDCSWYKPPALGTLQRTLNDFFAGAGRDVPSLVFVLIVGIIVGRRTWRAKDRTWLPLVFSGANIVFFAADLVATDLSWALSNWVVGPRIGIDAGYHRTWYVIAASGILWIVFWVVLIRLPIHDRPRTADD